MYCVCEIHKRTTHAVQWEVKHFMYVNCELWIHSLYIYIMSVFDDVIVIYVPFQLTFFAFRLLLFVCAYEFFAITFCCFVLRFDGIFVWILITMCAAAVLWTCDSKSVRVIAYRLNENRSAHKLMNIHFREQLFSYIDLARGAFLCSSEWNEYALFLFFFFKKIIISPSKMGRIVIVHCNAYVQIRGWIFFEPKQTISMWKSKNPKVKSPEQQ